LERLSIQRAQAVNDYWFVDESGVLFVSQGAAPETPYGSFVRESVSAPVTYVGGGYFRDQLGQALSVDLFRKSLVAPFPGLRDITACDGSACISRGSVVYLGSGDGRSVSKNLVDWHHGAAKEIVGGYALRADGRYEFSSHVLTEDGAVWTVASDGTVTRVEGLPPGEHIASGMLFERDGSAWSWGIGRSRLRRVFGEPKSWTDCSIESGSKGPLAARCAAPERLPALDGLQVLVTSFYIFTIDRNGVAGCTGYSPYDGDLPVCPPLP
jgi:hypothetical protein